MATLVDRATRFTIVVALPDGFKADVVAEALFERMGDYRCLCDDP